MKNRWMNAKWLGLITLLAVFASGCGKNNLSTLKPAGEVGQEQFNLMLLSIVIMAVQSCCKTLNLKTVLVGIRISE